MQQKLHLVWETDLVILYLFLIKCVTRSLNSFLILYYIFMNAILNNFNTQNKSSNKKSNENYKF